MIKNKKHLKIKNTIYKSFNLMYNINIIKVKEFTLKIPNKLNFWRSINMEELKVMLNERKGEIEVSKLANDYYEINIVKVNGEIIKFDIEELKENLSEIRFERINNKITLSIKPMEFDEIKVNEIENVSEIFIKSLSIAKNTIEQLNKILK